MVEPIPGHTYIVGGLIALAALGLIVSQVVSLFLN